MVVLTGGAAVSRSGVVLSGVVHGSIWRERVQVAAGQMRLSSNATSGMVVTPLWVWSVFVHLRSNRSPGVVTGWLGPSGTGTPAAGTGVCCPAGKSEFLPANRPEKMGNKAC